MTRIYANDEPAIDPGGNTVIRSKCSGALCSERINPDLPTEVIQNEDVYAQHRRGKVLGAGGTARYTLTTKPVNVLADDFQYKRFEQPT